MNSLWPYGDVVVRELYLECFIVIVGSHSAKFGALLHLVQAVKIFIDFRNEK